MKFLARRRWLTLPAIAVYMYLVMANHRLVQNTLRIWQNPLPPGRVNQTIFLATAALTIVLTAQVMRRSGSGGVLLRFWFLTLGLSAAAYWLLITSKVEVIHFPQYALLALLVFPCSRRAADSLLWITMCGGLDEAYQYAVLHPHWAVPWDFNDMVLNLIGGAFGLLALMSALPLVRVKPVPAPRFWREVLRWPAFATLELLLMASAVLAAAGKLTLRSAPGKHAWIALTRADPSPTFWAKVGPTEMRFHNLEVWEGMAIIVGFCLAFAAIDRRVRWARTE